ncbi:MAG: hypothetical protein ACYC5G_05480 [Candidatus Doudnabacteria bacterium]
MTDEEEILRLKDGECFIVPESDYGKAEVWLKNKTYFLFEIPIYGGEPQFHSDYRKNNIQKMIMEYNSWT